MPCAASSQLPMMFHLLIFATMSIKFLKMVAEGEHQRQDFKYCINDSRKIARSMVAFANTDGGRLLLGIRDNGSVAGVRSDEEYYMAEAAAKLYSKPPIDFQTRQWIIEGKTVLEIEIPKSEEHNHLAQNEEGKWLIYIRKNDQNIVAPGILLKVWEQQKNPKGVHIRFTDDESKLLSLLDTSQFLSLNQVTRHTKLSRHKCERLLVKLIVIGTAGMEINESGVKFFLREDLDESKKE
jgi:predicted HTH transcriptional regulator